MIAKLSSVLSFGLVTVIAGQAAAHDGDDCEGRKGARAPATYRGPLPAPVYTTPVSYPDGSRGNHQAAADYPRGYGSDGRAWGELDGLRQSDLNRDGWVTLTEAMQHGRRDFRRTDRDQNRVLTRREASWGDFAQDDRDRNGRISYGEYQDSIRRTFYRFDTNRDGVLASYELKQSAPRSAAWRR